MATPPNHAPAGASGPTLRDSGPHAHSPGNGRPAALPVWQPPSPEARARFLAALRPDANGLVAAIAQAEGTGEVLMLAWMNAEAVEETLATGRVTYYSRSRRALWRKGETSGQVQHLLDLRLDCDGDALLATVHQDGVACHTGRRSCFSWGLQDGAVAPLEPVLADPAALYGAARGTTDGSGAD
ncbi:phosphoribosyl-AMP cyclohydrolase [Roseomonas sp. WA12]